jgi:hypothetical protein
MSVVYILLRVSIQMDLLIDGVRVRLKLHYVFLLLIYHVLEIVFLSNRVDMVTKVIYLLLQTIF